jgi:hypothetical protein
MLTGAIMRRTDFFLFAAMLGLLEAIALLRRAGPIAANILLLILDDGVASGVGAEATNIGGSQAR